MTLRQGTSLGPYEIMAPLRAGAMGEVHKAKDARLDRFVALKVLPEPLAKPPDSRAHAWQGLRAGKASFTEACASRKGVKPWGPKVLR